MESQAIYVNHSSSSAFQNVVYRIVNGQLFVMNYDFDSSKVVTKPKGGKCSNQVLLDFSKLFAPGVRSDFVIKADGKEFKVHKRLIAAHSFVFEAMFSRDYVENQTNELTITEFDSEVVGQFVHYIYTGEVSSDKFAVDLFMLADLYDVEDLAAIAEEIIMRNVDDSNVADVFYLGYLHSAERLTYKAYSHAKKMFPGKPLLEMLSDPKSFVEFIRASKFPKTFSFTQSSYRRK